MGFLNRLGRFKEQLLNLVYPKTCFGCRKFIPWDKKGYLCGECLNKLDKLQPPFCVVCGKPLDILDSDRCPECTGYKYHFRRGYTASIYDGLIRDCIHNFKYNSCAYLGGTLADIMLEFASKNIPLQKIDAVVPVPLHWRRFRDRGFNQSAVLARILSKGTGIRFIGNGLCRSKAVHPQAELSRKERMKNLQGAFKSGRQKDFFGKHILVIDDVYTTGTTMNECAKVLLDSGAKEVWVFSLARGLS